MKNANPPIHLIGNSHIDLAWLWRWQEGFSEVKSTFRAALDRLEEYPDFIFTCAGACYYEWIEAFCPDMFKEISRYVRQGRWVPVNGWWIQPDCNLPCGESFARQSLYGQRYYLEKFGICCEVGYNVDSFGHSGMLPQILSKSGISAYVFMRPMESENKDLPDLFHWQSADGSSVLTFRIHSYSTGDLENLRFRLGYFKELYDKQGQPQMLFYGVGNHGGGPTIAMMDQIEKWREAGEPVAYSSPNIYRKAMENADLPVWKSDLQIHAIGCYSAILTVKQQNRRTETALLSAENLGAAAHMLLGADQQRVKLKEAWKRVMVNQFHDAICGCCIRSAYDDIAMSYGYAQTVAEEVGNLALQKISWQIDTLGDDVLPRSKDQDWKLWSYADKGTPFVVYNPMPFPIRQLLEAPGQLSNVTDDRLRPLPIQRIRAEMTNGDSDKWNTLFTADLPPMGYATYWLHKGAYPEQTDGALTAEGMEMSNGRLKVVFDGETGGILQIISEQSGEKHLSAPGAIGRIIDETHSDTWGHGLFEYRDVVGSFQVRRMDWVERGPMRATMRIMYVYGDSTLRQDISLEKDADFIDLKLMINWREKHKQLKLEFPVSAPDGVLTAEIPYGVIQRPMDGTEKPIQRWLDVSGTARGLAIVNDSTHGADIKDGLVRLTVLRSPIYADHFGVRDEMCEYTEQGERRVRFRLVPHSGDWRGAGVVRHAWKLNTPVQAVCETYHKGPLPTQASVLRIDQPGVIATALKEAEDGGAYIMRCHEAYGKDIQAKIELPLVSRGWTARFSPFEIKTFRIPYDPEQSVSDVDLIERDR